MCEARGHKLRRSPCRGLSNQRLLPHPKGWGSFLLPEGLCFLIYDLNPPGCGALFLQRGAGPACKKQTAFLLRLADFCGAPRRVLAKTGALRQARLAASSTGRASACLPLLRFGCFCRRQRLSCAAHHPFNVTPALRARPLTGALNQRLLLLGAGCLQPQKPLPESCATAG